MSSQKAGVQLTPVTQPPAGAAVEFRQVSKHYAGGPAAGAVVDLSLRVEPGEICVLVGPSGCGKTTSLKMVNRLVEPTSGEIFVDGRNVASLPATELRRGIGYVIQQIGLFPHYTVAQNVATVPTLLKWPAAQIRARVDELLDLVGLDAAVVRDRYPAQLSGGERQRVGVARALAVSPPVLLMDEPFGAVDPVVRERLQDEFLRIQRTFKTTVLFVTHDIDEAIKLGDRVAVMQRGGRLAQYAPPEELLARPASDFVAQFVGADRGLKRLRLRLVGDAMVRVSPAGRTPDVDLPGPTLGRNGGPVTWANGQAALVVHPEMSLHEALSRLLAAGDEMAAVVDDHDGVIGVLTLRGIAAHLGAAAPPSDQAQA